MTLAGELRERVRFERRRENGDDGYGNVQYEWQRIAGPMTARIKPARGGEQVLADRLSGVEVFEIIVRWFSKTRITDPGYPPLPKGTIEGGPLDPGDRCVNERSGAIYNIRSITNPDEQHEFLSIIAQSGMAT